MGPGETTNFLQSTGLVGALILFIFVVIGGLYKEGWVPGPFYRDLKKERDELRATNQGYEAHFQTLTAVAEKQAERIAALTAQISGLRDDLADVLAGNDGKPPARRRAT